MTVYYKSEVFSTPYLLFHEYERKKVATIVMDALYNYMGYTIVLVSDGGKYIRLLGKTCLITSINRMNHLFKLPYLYISVNCNGGKQTIIARIFNHIAEKLGINIHMGGQMEYNFDEMCSIMKDLIHDYNREIVIFLGNAELIDPDELNDIAGILNPLGVSIIATYNLQINRERYTRLNNIDTVLFIKPPTRKQLFLIYQRQAQILKLKLPEDFIEYIISIQYQNRIFDRSFGLEILNRLKSIQEEKVLDVWECINITVEYTQKIGNPISFQSNDITNDQLKENNLIEFFFKNLFAYFLGPTNHFYITLEELIEIYQVSVENSEMEYNEEILNELLVLSHNIGLLYPINRGNSKGEVGRFFIGWSKYIIEISNEIFFKSIEKTGESFSGEDQLNLIDENKEKSTEEISEFKPVRLNIKNLINIKNLTRISYNFGITVEEIIQYGKNISYNIKDIITDNVSLFLIVDKLRGRAPLCKFIKSNGERCQKHIRHKSGYCHHHR